MFTLIGSLIWLGIAGGAGVFGYFKARQFTINKLRFVDAVHKGIAPIAAGLFAALIATPVAWLVPFHLVTSLTVILFGGSVALGVASGARDIRRRIGAG
ncbi:MAG: hypothetical protein ACREPM_13025 [Gemmatimonadaceae bacterium]